MAVTIKTNVKKVAKSMDRFVGRIDDEIADALETQAREVVNDAQSRAPVRSGTLRASIRSRRAGNTVTIEATADYARFVHENPRGRGYKFLETPIAQRTDDMAREAERELRRAARAEKL